jgi:predicted phosphodiesterase
MDVTTVSDTEAVIHDGLAVTRLGDLQPDSDHHVAGARFRTLPSPRGELLCRIATVNDVHLGEIEAGRLGDLPDGPIRRSEPGGEPYPEMMSRVAAEEIAAVDPAAVIVKGDLSLDGAPDEWAAFEACYREPFGERLHVVRGNHDAYHHQADYAGDQWIELPGVVVALLDTTIPGSTSGDVTAVQAEWLADRAAGADRPVLVMGHHQQWISKGDGRRSDDYFGIHPDGSDRLDQVCASNDRIIAYAAGHTHRHRVRRMARSGLPTIEVGCTKDFPGTWAEYRVHESDVMQVVHRMSAPDALEWSESCRTLYSDFGVDYESYALGTLAERCFLLAVERG